VSLSFCALKAEDIFFDLGGVLFHSSRQEAIKAIGLKNCLNYYVQLKKPENGKKYLFNSLDRLKAKSARSPQAYDGQLPLPQYIIDWLRGNYPTNADLLHDVHHGINELELSSQDKEFIKGVARFMFDPAIFAQSVQIIPEGLEILQACYAQQNPDGSRAHRLFIISNWDAESYEILCQRPDLQHFWSMFDGAIISGQVKSMKPEREIFDIARHIAHNKEGGIFIDDQPENIEAANQLNFRGALCDSHESIWQILEDNEIVQPRTFMKKHAGKMQGVARVALCIGGLYYAGPLLAKTSIGQWIAKTSIARSFSTVFKSIPSLKAFMIGS
jgi:FMN phosphatase YigB (HAD superfamily)